MRAILSLLLLSGLAATAQWSADPATPLVVSTNAGTPANLVAFSDGEEGWFVLWRDKRTDGINYEIYGQHLDMDGYSLWTANGRLVHHEEGASIGEFNARLLPDGNILMALVAGASTFGDTLKAMLCDAEADPLWTDPVNITQEGGGSILGLDALSMVPTSDGAIIGWYDTYFGGSNGVNVSRITNEGEVLWPENGYAIPGATYGPYNMLPDGADGVIVNWRTGNGIGAGYMAMRVDSTGTNAWDANITTNAGGNGFGGNHVLRSGANASMVMAYADSQNKVQLLQVDTTGALLFDPSPIAVCGFASSQGQVSMVMEDGITTLVWADNRPPASNQDVYMQRFDNEGTLLLDADGVLVMHLNTYIPTTGLVPSSDGVIATIDGNVAGYSAMRMNSDGTPAWPTPTAFCAPASNPFYALQHQLPDGEGGIVSFWLTSSGTLHGARIRANGSLGGITGMAEHDRPSVVVFPNPAEDRITLAGLEDVRIQRIDLFSAHGTLVRTLQPNTTLRTIDVASLPTGLYHVRITAAQGQYSACFAKR